MASVQDCERALLSLVDRLAAVDAGTRTRYAVDRTVSWRVTDLDVVFAVRFVDGAMGDLRCSASTSQREDAQVRLTGHSDDLVALVSGALSPPVAWATGRLKVEASVLDLLKLRALL